MKTEIIISADAPTKHSAASAISEINRLHAEAQRLVGESRSSLDAALTAAWRAGKLLIAEKASIRRHAGRGAWLPWLKTCFHGGVRTAQRYMQFARRVDSPDALCGLGLRQAYLRLGISMSSKTSPDSQRARPLKRPTHAMLAAKLIRLLRNRKHNGSRLGSLIHPSPELDTLYTLLGELYESTKHV
ncbi:hypothetical protein [Ereboglobus luteus]|uniref:DUF3102 domain-containing protein n=1 Tax=Ereboglobus luteus TaxID=1796921 RepID=A0A2U8E3Y6_9BACT|nr:hypothetical protein [Ereboglobus luteus]AWI09628.1 hypothetical protein CKA38_10555 [Ereboglobus luteus]